ncbi:UNVERIFIED_CONTAM: mannosyltransferase [Siphonaria sp. JEL0065]|nr:mannosyltransferase [Siphonaria sp. JEL0065]
MAKWNKKDPADQPHLTHLVGYKGSTLSNKLENHGRLKIHRIPSPTKITAKNPILFLITAAVRVVKQLVQLFWLLFVQLPCSQVIIVQNPPAIPTLLIAQLLRFFRGSKLIIDWHNFGFSIMAIGKSKGNLIVRLAKWYEMTLGRVADGHLCVTRAMAEELKNNWKIRGKCVVLYDRAPAHFRRLDLSEIHEFLSTMEIIDGIFDYKTISSPFPINTLLTCQMTPTSKPSYTAKRPALLVSSTSWTPDEDFSILLAALIQYDNQAHAGHANLVVIVTGKGPQKKMYQFQISQLKLKKVTILTAWLSVEDYPKLLGSADLGVCLHTSSSGLDLPMKVVDMFGCGLPVCAFGYPCLNELVQHDVNGLVFVNSRELCEQLLRLFDGFSRMDDTSELQILAQGTKAFQAERWAENWEKNVGSVFFSD